MLLSLDSHLIDSRVPVRTGYEFDGWYYDAELTQPVTESDRLTAPVTLYAKLTKGEDVPAPGWFGSAGEWLKDNWVYLAIGGAVVIVVVIAAAATLGGGKKSKKRGKK